METIGIIIQKKSPLISLASAARTSSLNTDLSAPAAHLGMCGNVINQSFQNQMWPSKAGCFIFLDTKEKMSSVCTRLK